MITVLLSFLAVAALALTAWDAIEGANTTGKRRRAKIAVVVGVLAIGIQCWQTLRAGVEPRQRMIEAIAAEQIANLQRIDSWSRPEE